MGSPGKRLLGGCGLVLLLTLLAVVGVAQVGDDPRNTSSEYQDAMNGASCYAHHAGEGFRPFDYNFVNTYSQLPVNEDVVIQVRVRYPVDSMTSPQEFVQDIGVLVNTTHARNVRVLTEDTPDDLQETYSLTLPPGTPLTETFSVASGAQSGRVTARLLSVSPVPADVEPGEWTVTVQGIPLQGDAQEKTVELTRDQFREKGSGDWIVEARWQHPLATVPADWQATIEIDVEVLYAQEATEFLFRAERAIQVGREPNFVLIPVPVRILSEEPASLDFRVEAIVYWQHKPGDGAPLDEGLFYRFMTMNVVGGDELVEGQSFVGPLPSASVDLYNLFTRLLGMIGLFLVLVTMVTGGVFGRSTRRFMNKITGGAKKRVLWHSAAGFLIIVVATVHFLVALLDTSDDISKGLLWGGVAWVLLVSLGFSGYYQVRIIKRWNYRVWRHLHLWSAVGVLLFLIVHTVLDGSDFAFLHEVLPGWYERLIWPRPTTGGGMA
jgi:hypothetical protein